jgi:hypothetical protein
LRKLAKEYGPDGINGRPFLTDGPPATGYPTGEKLSNREQETLNLIYQGQDLLEMCSGSDLTADAIFLLLQRRVRCPDSLLLDSVQIPTDWKVDQEALVVAVQDCSFLFSLGVFNQFHDCPSGSELVRILTVAFEDYSNYSDRQWEFMAIFVLELAFKHVVHDPQTIEKLHDEIARLKSLL